MRSAVDQAKSAANTARDTGADLGARASGIGSTLTPFLTSELEHPQGYSQTDQAAMTGAALGGAGGAMSGFAGEGAQRAAVSRNAGGFQASLADAARQRMKAAAGASEGIAGNNANLKVQQQQDAARGLQGMYGTDVGGQLQSQGQIAGDVKAEADANQTGWLQNTLAAANQATQTIAML